jgi:hypothetical protein
MFVYSVMIAGKAIKSSIFNIKPFFLIQKMDSWKKYKLGLKLPFWIS